MKAVKNIKLVTNENMRESEGQKFLDAIYLKAKIGASIEEIASYLDMDTYLLRELYNTNKKVQKAYKKGQVEATLEFKEAIRNQALNGNKKAIDKYKETMPTLEDNGIEKFKGRLDEVIALLEENEILNTPKT